jgi:hypothetical protein
MTRADGCSIDNLASLPVNWSLGFRLRKLSKKQTVIKNGWRVFHSNRPRCSVGSVFKLAEPTYGGQ